MTSHINNHLLSFRARPRCLDEPAHALVWRDQPPPIFGRKVGEIRAKLETLSADAAVQSAPATGVAAQKDRAETALENAAFALARLVVVQAQDAHDDVLAHKFDSPISHWRKLRDEPLLQRARLLETEARKVAVADPAQAALYGITPTALDAYHATVENYAAFIVAPHDTIAHRHVLTTSLPAQVRALTALFDQIADLLPQFTTPEGLAFAAAYHATAPIINRGHRHETPNEDPEPESNPAPKDEANPTPEPPKNPPNPPTPTP